MVIGGARRRHARLLVGNVLLSLELEEKGVAALRKAPTLHCLTSGNC
ncbi:hypothetical protein E2C01_101027 [Portunus trituberculatus]|uniref:Uncharacterized protein n=1 Tax=Portunus trituberculatus TaxID=210409 RepID=A0A5B7K4M7_PORTR|nr:hypothetical protein [Portunus trituberculatus]